jgi:hypothetical protein
MAVIYIEQAGIRFELKNSGRVVSTEGLEGLSGLVYVTGSEVKRYPKNAEKIARRVKNKSYVVDGEFVYYYKGEEIEKFKDCIISPYQVLINSFLFDKKSLSGNVLLVDGSKEAAIVSLIIEGEFKELLISSAALLNDTLSTLNRNYLQKGVKLDFIVINDEFYKPAFNSSKIPVTLLSPTEVLEYAQEFQAPVFRRIEDIQKKLRKERDKKLNMILAVSAVIFILNLAVYLAFKNAVNSTAAVNNSIIAKNGILKQKLNLEIEKKFLSFTRKNMPKELKRTLLKIASLKNIEITDIEADNSNFTIKGRFLGGYRNFVKGYNELKSLMAADRVSYVVSAQGKASFVLKGEI